MSRTQIDASLVPSASLAASNMSNILDNAGFEIWQRGTTFSNPASGAYCADRWQVGKSGGITVNITKETTIISSGTASIKVDTTVASGSSMYVIENIENYQDFQGKTVTYSCRVRTSTANKIRLAMADGVTQSFSSYHSGGGTFETLSMTFTVNAAATNLSCYIGMVADTVVVNTFYADAAMLVMGSSVPTYMPTPPQVDLARCQRYFYATPAVSNIFLCHGQCQNSTTSAYIFRFPVSMRIGPTLTVNNTTNFTTWDAGGNPIALTSLFNAGGGANTDTYLLQGLVASGLVTGNATSLRTGNANAQLFFSADI